MRELATKKAFIRSLLRFFAQTTDTFSATFCLLCLLFVSRIQVVLCLSVGRYTRAAEV